MITIKNDKKEKFQSFEINFKFDELKSMYNYDFNLIAYGENENAAAINLSESIMDFKQKFAADLTNFINKLKTKLIN